MTRDECKTIIEAARVAGEQPDLRWADKAWLFQAGDLVICEPCDCGRHIRHNNGGNYHQIITLRENKGQWSVRYDDTYEFAPAAEWQPCDDPIAVIKEHADWL